MATEGRRPIDKSVCPPFCCERGYSLYSIEYDRQYVEYVCTCTYMYCTRRAFGSERHTTYIRVITGLISSNDRKGVCSCIIFFSFLPYCTTTDAGTSQTDQRINTLLYPLCETPVTDEGKTDAHPLRPTQHTIGSSLPLESCPSY